jgi:hypothetical protein
MPVKLNKVILLSALIFFATGPQIAAFAKLGVLTL